VCPKKGGIPRPSRAWDFPTLTPLLFITFFLYRPHRHKIGIVSEFTDSTASRTVPVSRDGPKIRRKTIFGGFFDNIEDKQ